jgi:hypothetical protein
MSRQDSSPAEAEAVASVAVHCAAAAGLGRLLLLLLPQRRLKLLLAHALRGRGALGAQAKRLAGPGGQREARGGQRGVGTCGARPCCQGDA